tara:strand:+ start:311 stop:1894 length:1584 start_codon:yes stop_codon:yes gene_type:complete
MKINKLKIQNFYSIRELELSFDDYKGLVVIKGKNKDTGGSNGSGKSIIFEALIWGLFGKTIRKSNEEALVNSTAKKKCVVTVTLNNDTVIVRGRKPTKLEFHMGEDILTQESVIETQKLIERILNTNYKVFMSSMVFGQHAKTDFLSATPEDKRVIIRNFLNLDDIFQKRDKIKEYKSEANQGIKTITAVLDEHIKSIEQTEGKLGTLEKDKSKFSYDDLNIDLDIVLSLEQEVRDLEGKISTKGASLRTYEKAKKGAEAALKKKDVLCPTCGVKSPVDEKDQKKKASSAQGQITKVSNEIVKLEEKVTSIDIPISSSEYAEYLEYKNLLEKEQTYREFIDEVKEKIIESDREKVGYINRYEIMRFWEKAFSEHGVIKYIIRNILDFFNNKTNEYLSYLTHNQFLIKFDEELNETIINNGKKVCYISLSGGEQRKVNLAVMLALQGLLSLTEKEQSNLLFFDEIAENLDYDGLKGLYILLQELKKEKTVFIITHNKIFKTFLDNAERITIVKSNGESRLLNDYKAIK